MSKIQLLGVAHFSVVLIKPYFPVLYVGQSKSIRAHSSISREFHGTHCQEYIP
jgi:hypothetical protein